MPVKWCSGTKHVETNHSNIKEYLTAKIGLGMIKRLARHDGYFPMEWKAMPEPESTVDWTRRNKAALACEYFGNGQTLFIPINPAGALCSYT
jgi:hypothetical protein